MAGEDLTGRGISRERLAALIADGRSVAEIAAELGRSNSTVRHWLGRHKLRAAGRAGQRGSPTPSGDRPTQLRVCRTHGKTMYVQDRAGVYRCRRCRVDAVTRRRRRVKQVLVNEAGGCCAVCGYSRYVGALQFHHRDPSEKVLSLSTNGVTLAIDFLRSEAAKCVLLCSNCHAEVEGGVTALPVH